MTTTFAISSADACSDRQAQAATKTSWRRPLRRPNKVFAWAPMHPQEPGAGICRALLRTLGCSPRRPCLRSRAPDLPAGALSGLGWRFILPADPEKGVHGPLSPSRVGLLRSLRVDPIYARALPLHNTPQARIDRPVDKRRASHPLPQAAFKLASFLRQPRLAQAFE
jgi:hypothetical protein